MPIWRQNYEINQSKSSVKTFARSSSALVLGTLFAGQAAFAAPYCFQYTDIIANTTAAGLVIGDPIKVTAILDNGGSSLNSQTWTFAHLQSIAYDFKNGALKTTFTSPWGGDGLDSTTGSFVTDGTGTLTSVPSNWFDTSFGTNFTTNGSTPLVWYLNGSNDEYYATGSVAVSFSANTTVASNWTGCSSTSTPVNAPIDLNFNKPVETFASEIELK